MIQRKYKLRNWSVLLNKYITDTRNAPFRWGKNDCAQWALGAVDVQCGSNLAQRFGGYDSAITASNFVEERGWISMLDGARQVFGAELLHPLEFQRGDLIWIPPGVVDCTDSRIAHVGNFGIIADGQSVFIAAKDCVTPFPCINIILSGSNVFPVGAMTYA